MSNEPISPGERVCDVNRIDPGGEVEAVQDRATPRPGRRRVVHRAIEILWSISRLPVRWFSANKNRILFECSILGASVIGVLLLVYVGQLVDRQLIPDLAGYVVATPTPPTPLDEITVPHQLFHPNSGEALPVVLKQLPDSPDSMSLSGNVAAVGNALGNSLLSGGRASRMDSDYRRQRFDFYKNIVNSYNNKIKLHNLDVMSYRRASFLYHLANFFALSLLIYLIVRPLLSAGSVYIASVPEKELLLRDTDQVTTALVTMIRRRARRSRLSAVLVLAMLLICLVSGLAFFVFAGAIARSSVRPGLTQSGFVDTLEEEFEDLYRASREESAKTPAPAGRPAPVLNSPGTSPSPAGPRSPPTEPHVNGEPPPAADWGAPGANPAAAPPPAAGPVAAQAASPRTQSGVPTVVPPPLARPGSPRSIGSTDIYGIPSSDNVFGTLSAKSKDDLVAKMQKIGEQNESLWGALNAYLSTSEALRETIASLATRVGAVFLLLFLVQILVSLYRYNIRLASYYDARADALQLSNRSEGEEFAKLVLVLSPENLEFGRSRYPTSEIAKFLKDFASPGEGKKKQGSNEG